MLRPGPVCSLFLAVFVTMGTEQANAQSTTPIVVELFTSQSCDVCTPADDFLGILAKRSDVIALSYHVSMWDYLGWQDTFANEWTSERHKTYAAFLHERSLYTPQMVIGGTAHEVGSRRDKVAKAIDEQRERSAPYLDIRVERIDDRTLSVLIPAGNMNQRDVGVLLVRYDSLRKVAIEGGENNGRTLVYHNVVSDYHTLGMWYGRKLEIRLNVADLREGGRDGSVVLVQEGGSGRIIGAIRIDLDRF